MSHDRDLSAVVNVFFFIIIFLFRHLDLNSRSKQKMIKRIITKEKNINKVLVGLSAGDTSTERTHHLQPAAEL